MCIYKHCGFHLSNVLLSLDVRTDRARRKAKFGQMYTIHLENVKHKTRFHRQNTGSFVQRNFTTTYKDVLCVQITSENYSGVLSFRRQLCKISSNVNEGVFLSYLCSNLCNNLNT